MRYLITIRYFDGTVLWYVKATENDTTGRRIVASNLRGRCVRSVLITEYGNGSRVVDSWYADRDAELLIDQ